MSEKGIEEIRALVRPALTGFFSIAWLIITAILILESISVTLPYVLLTVITWGVIVWYYDDRTFFHRHSSPLNVIYNWLSRK